VKGLEEFQKKIFMILTANLMYANLRYWILCFCWIF